MRLGRPTVGMANGSLAINWSSSLPIPTQPSLPSVGWGWGVPSLSMPCSKTLQIQGLTHAGWAGKGALKAWKELGTLAVCAIESL